MIGRKTFEDSVDLENPLTVDTDANPNWPRGQLCWEAKGPIARVYTRLESKIDRELDQSVKQTDRGIKVSLVMIGRKARRAQPQILFTSTDKQARKDALQAILESRLLANTEFKLGHLRHPPSGPIKEVAMEDQQTFELQSSSAPREIFFEPSDRIRLVGMPILIRHNATSIRRATANAIYNGEEFGYITAAHAFDEIATKDEDTDEDDEEIDIEFDDSNTDDESYDDGEGRDMLSQHSDTSPEESVSGRSLESLDTSLSRGPSLESNDSYNSLTMSAPSEASHQLESAVDAKQDTGQERPSIRCRTLGKVSTTVKALDFAIITVTDAEVISALEKLRGAAKDTRFMTEIAETSGRSIIAWSSHGPLHGKLLESPVSMRFSNSGSYERVYKFKFRHDEEIRMGDCGTLVTDTESRILFGHVIAVSDNVRIAYVVAAQRTAQEMERSGRWQLLSIGDQDFKEGVIEHDSFPINHAGPFALDPSTEEVSKSLSKSPHLPLATVRYSAERVATPIEGGSEHTRTDKDSITNTTDDLSFLGIKLGNEYGATDAILKAVLPNGKVILISDAINPFKLLGRCPLLYHAFEYSSQSRLQASIEASSETAVISLVRYCYTGNYFKDKLDGSSVLLLQHAETYKIADDFDLPELQLLAQGNFSCQIEFACCLPKYPSDLLDTIRFFYRHLTSDTARRGNSLVDSLLNYCVAFYFRHKLGESPDFLTVVHEIPAFRQDLYHTNVARDFYNDCAAMGLGLLRKLDSSDLSESRASFTLPCRPDTRNAAGNAGEDGISDSEPVHMASIGRTTADNEANSDDEWTRL